MKFSPYGSRIPLVLVG